MGAVYVEELDSNFMLEDIREGVKRVKNNKASGNVKRLQYQKRGDRNF
jgi:hypothetical protein